MPLKSLRRLILTCVLISLVLVLGITVTWNLVAADHSLADVRGAIMQNPNEVNEYLEKNQPKDQRPELRIPTGVFLQDVEFIDVNSVAVNGYIWQNFPASPPLAQQGVVLPEAGDSYAPKEVYRVKGPNGRVTVGWYFSGILHQPINYQHYPLDNQNVVLRLWSVDIEGGVQLVPDFAAYPPWQYTEMYGLERGFQPTGWSPQFTAFTFQKHHYSSSFGVNGPHAASIDTVELYFNIGLVRKWQGPMFASLTRASFIALLVYLGLFVYTREEARRRIFGFSTWAVITFTVSMLLALILDQQQTRTLTGGATVAYLEFFSITLYVVIISVALNAVLVTSREIEILQWRDNLLPKLVYWPLLLGLSFLFTVVVFRNGRS
ncbi:hypothetical protein ACFWDI_06385 [Streptomyces sp. NPDC060064]|uniref:hypothetical protein n=1 Tax=Streptomyces sp. NPDC060064 TaxID=3347049 RepID=UPI0036941078